MFYFSYAANLNRTHMARLCPGAEPLYPAVLEGCFLTVRRWFNVEPEEGGMVYGGVWEVNPEHLSRLDSYEDYPELYERRKMRIFPLEHGRVGAWEHGGEGGIDVSGYPTMLTPEVQLRRTSRCVGEKAEHLAALPDQVECLVYVMKEPFVIPLSAPDPGYLKMVKEGYGEWGLSSEQVRSALMTAVS